MNLKLRAIEDRGDAVELVALIERGARESAGSYLSEGSFDGLGDRFLEQSFGRRESLLLAAEADGVARALAVTAPFEDPLTGERIPMLIVLYVDPALRHRGVARALVQETRRLLRARGLEVLAARAAHNDDAIISMGERWGLVRAWEYMSTE